MPATTEKKEASAAVGKTGKTWLWSSLTILGALIVLSASVLAFVMNTNKNIYPNVYADGIKLGGLSVEQADNILTKHVYEQLKDFYVAISTPGGAGDTLVFTDDIQPKYDTGITAQSAHDVGRTGSFPKRVADIWKAYFSKVEIPITSAFDLDANAVSNCERIASEVAANVDIPVAQYSYAIDEYNITIQNAETGRSIDQMALTGDIIDRFTQLDVMPIIAEPVEIIPDPLDVDSLHSLVYKEPIDAYLDVESQRTAKIMGHQIGVDFDTALLRSELNTGKPVIVIPLIYTMPEVTQQILQENLFKDQLSSFTTYLTASNVPRTGNINLAAGIINGTILAPGDVFSFNDTVGQRTAARGFREAGAYVNGQLVPELGGGICQMSTTAYNAALFANLKIVERNNHSMTVAYVPVGQDAMVNWGTSDLKFENNTQYPIQIFAEQSGNYVRVSIMGTKAEDFSVKINVIEHSKTPYERVEHFNAALPAGATKTIQDGHHGYVVDSYRIVRDADGNIISQELEAKSRYRKTDHVVEVGPAAEDTPEATPNPDIPPETETSPSPETTPSSEPSPEPEAATTPSPAHDITVDAPPDWLP